MEQPSTLTAKLNELRSRYFGSSRGSRVRLSVATGLVAKGAQLLSAVLVTPLVVRYLGNEGYGLFVTITAVVTWLQISNFGIGAGLQNALTEAVAAADVPRQRALVSTAFFFLLGITILLICGTAASFFALPWTSIFPSDSPALASEVPTAVAIVLTGFVSTFALSFVHSIYAARQQLHIPNYAALATAALILCGTFAAVHFDSGLVGVTAATVGAAAAVNWVFAFGYLMVRANRDLRPTLAAMSRAAGARIFRSSLAFFVIQICSVALFQTDFFIIAQFASVQEVTPYSVATKPFNILSVLLLSAVIHPLWAAYGNAMACRDIEWIKRSHKRAVIAFMALYSAAFVVMIAVGKPLLAWWVGPAAAPTTALIAATGAYYLIRQWADLHASLVNGLDMMMPQAFSAVVHVFVTITLEIVLIRTIGVIGVPIACFLGYALVSAWYLPLLASRSLHRLSEQSLSRTLTPATAPTAPATQ